MGLISLWKKIVYEDDCIDYINYDEYCNEKLQIMAAKGSVRKTRYWLNKGANIDSTDDNGLTALHFATIYNEKKVIKLLLCSGADVDAKGGQNGFSALHIASLNGWADEVSLLLNYGANVNQECNDGGTALHTATIWKSEEELNEGHIEVVKLLIDAGVDVNGKDNDGYVPLNCECEIIREILIEAGAVTNFDMFGEIVKYGAKRLALNVIRDVAFTAIGVPPPSILDIFTKD